MASSADMARINADGSIDFTHVSGDGYPSGLGAILLMRYTEPAALDGLFAGDHIEEMQERPDDLYFLDDERDPSWPWNIDETNYVFKDGAWHWRDWESDSPPLKPLTREDIIRDAEEYGSEESVTRYLDGKQETLF